MAHGISERDPPESLRVFTIARGLRDPESGVRSLFNTRAVPNIYLASAVCIAHATLLETTVQGECQRLAAQEPETPQPLGSRVFVEFE
jgi:hypothetical protein